MKFLLLSLDFQLLRIYNILFFIFLSNFSYSQDTVKKDLIQLELKRKSDLTSSVMFDSNLMLRFFDPFSNQLFLNNDSAQIVNSNFLFQWGQIQLLRLFFKLKI